MKKIWILSSLLIGIIQVYGQDGTPIIEILPEDAHPNTEMDESIIEEADDPDTEVVPPIMVSPDVMPEFPGGSKAFAKFLGENIKYPELAMETNTQGKVYVKFVVRKDGNIDQVQILRGIGAGCDEEAVRVIKSGPKWKPGEQMGKPVNVWFTVPINFSLSTMDKDAVIASTDNQIVPEYQLDKLPSYPGGDRAMLHFLMDNMKYPSLAEETKTQGDVLLVMVVKKDGSLDQIKVWRGIGAGCDEEAVRVARLFPKWTPGEVDGEPVNCTYSVTIKYRL